MRNYKERRNKAFLGAIISAVGGIAGSVINSINQGKIARQQAITQNRNDTYQIADNLTNSYADQSYADEFEKIVVFKRGGKAKATDNIRYVSNDNLNSLRRYPMSLNDLNRYRCGGLVKRRYDKFGL